MSYAPNYSPTVGFSTEETNNVAGRSTVRTPAIDNELANISSSINALNTNLKALQRDDGKLKDMLIEPYALSEQARSLIASGGNVRGAWSPATVYAQGDAAQYGSTAYLCHTAHTSSASFDTGLWMAISGDGSSFDNAVAAAASASAASGSASSASGSASAASSSAAAASASASAASGHATTASNAASAAAASATQAANLISSSTAGASQAEAEAGTDNSKYMSPLRTAQAIVGASRTFTKSQRGTATADNDLSFDLNVTNNFSCTPGAGGTLTFTNIASAAGQSGNILLVNGSNYVIAKAATVKCDASFLSTISTTGTFRVSYYSDGTNVYVTTSQALS